MLQAVTEIPFPINDGMCTKFATEIVLERTHNEGTSIEVCIIPSADETEKRGKALRDWQPTDFDELETLNTATMKRIFSEVSIRVDLHVISSSSRANIWFRLRR